jgi:predicted Zn-dependent peptidase
LYNQQHFKDGALGTAETVGSITSDDVKNYIRKYFVKNNCYIQICSPLSFSKIKSIVKKNFEQDMPSNKLKPLPYEEDKLTDAEGVSVNYKDLDKSYLSVFFKSSYAHGETFSGAFMPSTRK